MHETFQPNEAIVIMFLEVTVDICRTSLVGDDLYK